jgi:short-subunit dehydrogenase
MVVVITGASAGIGRALAEQLSRHGVKLVLSARRLERLEALNQSLGGRHLVVQADVSRPEDCAALVRRAVEHFGRIDTLVCNAGYGMVRRVHEMTRQEMLDILATNVLGTTDCIAAAVPVMMRQTPRDGWRGQVMIVSSAAARRGLPYFGAYSATKAAQLSLAEAMRVELRPRGIAVTSVHPIGTDTDFFTTAEHLSAKRIPRRSAIEVHQSAQTVARKMVRGIQRPAPEVWPFRPVRFLLSLGMMWPRLTDWAMAGHRKQLGKVNESK